MQSAGEKLAILAAAGSRKTQTIVETALNAGPGRILVVTYTSENQRIITDRLEREAGVIPENVQVMGWFSFLIGQCARPYQRALTGEPFWIAGLNFKGRRGRFAKKSQLGYFFDKDRQFYRDGVSDFVVSLDAKVGGAVIRRLESVYSHILVDEIQDLVGYDLDVLDRLMNSRLGILLVGDPRQHTYSTNLGPRNKKYHGVGLFEWLKERAELCKIEERTTSFRCCQAICDFADAIYPGLPATKSVNVPGTGHDGVVQVLKSDLAAYTVKYGPMAVLRYDKKSDTCGLQATNIGLSKGSTSDRVIVFPTKPMINYLRDHDPTALRSPEKLYVAVTRARFSVAFAVDEPVTDSIPLVRNL